MSGGGRGDRRDARAEPGSGAPSDRVEREIERELAFHIESRVEELVAAGVAPEEARERALREFGDLESARDDLARIDRRRGGRRRRAEWWGSLRQDALFALRTLRRSPGFAAVALATLALGIGANTAIFSAVDALVLRPLPFAASDRLVALWMEGPEGRWISPETYVAMRGRTRTLDGLEAWSGWSFAVTGDGAEAEMVDGARVSPGFFDLLGVPPALGRTLVDEDALPWSERTYAGASAVVLSHGYWMRRYGGDPAAVGRTITLDGMAVPIVGVLPATFTFPTVAADVWVPFAIDPALPPGVGGYLRLVGKLDEGATAEAAVAEAAALGSALHAERPDRFPETFGGEAVVRPLKDDLMGSTRTTLLLLLGAVGFVLLVACANVANLFLARSTGRASEMRVRTALGAGHARLLRQVMTEHLVLAGLGAFLGLALAAQGTRLLAAALPADLTAARPPAIDARVLAFTLAVTLAAALLSGLAPSLRAAGGRGAPGLTEGSRGGGVTRERRRLLDALVVGELAMALVLVVGAGLMLQSFWRLSRQDPGFRPEGVLTFHVAAPEASYATAAEREQLLGGILERVAALPGVSGVGAVHLLPLGGNNWSAPLAVEGRELPAGAEPPSVSWRVASDGYFSTAGIPVLAGRGFTEEDRRGAPPVALLSETGARELFPGEDPVGRRVIDAFDGDRAVTIVGVVGDTKDVDLAGARRPQFYRPYAQYSLAAMTYVVRTDGEPLALARPVRDIVAELGSDLPVSGVRALDEVVAASIAEPRLLTLLLGGFGAVALLMAVLGIYGVIGYAVGQRTREFGIRLALGARPRDVRVGVVLDGARLAAIGLALGIPGAWALTRFLEGALYEVAPTDLRTFVAVSALLTGVALVGAWLPARRAGRVDPATSLSEG